jgi:predicted secreted protein
MSRILICCALLLGVAACDEERPPVVVDRLADGTAVTVTVDERLWVRLENFGDGGYSPWVLDAEPDPAVLPFVRSWHQDPASPMPGAFGTDVFEFRGVAPGSTSIEASASQPWEGGETVTFTLDVTVE